MSSRGNSALGLIRYGEVEIWARVIFLRGGKIFGQKEAWRNELADDDGQGGGSKIRGQLGDL